MGPSVVVAGVATGGVAAHLHLLVKRPGQLVVQRRAPLRLAVLPLATAGCCREPLQDLLQHPASADTSTGALV